MPRNDSSRTPSSRSASARPAQAPQRIKPSLGLRRLLYLSVTGLFASGAVWLLLHYFGRVSGAYGPETNPFEPWSLCIHGAFAALSLILIGSLLPTHILPALDGKRHRASGISMLSVWAVLILTGYLLYYAGGEDLRQAVSLIHWVVGLGLPLSLLIHVRRRPRKRRTRGARAAAAVATEQPGPYPIDPAS